MVKEVGSWEQIAGKRAKQAVNLDRRYRLRKVLIYELIRDRICVWRLVSKDALGIQLEMHGAKDLGRKRVSCVWSVWTTWREALQRSICSPMTALLRLVFSLISFQGKRRRQCTAWGKKKVISRMGNKHRPQKEELDTGRKRNGKDTRLICSDAWKSTRKSKCRIVTGKLRNRIHLQNKENPGCIHFKGMD